MSCLRNTMTTANIRKVYILALLHVALSNVFRPGFVYKFAYRGQVVTSIPSLNDEQTTALRLGAVCSIVATHNDSIYIAQLENVEFHHKFTNGRMEMDSLNDDVNVWNKDTRIPEEQLNILKEHLVKPIKFRYVSGSVREIWSSRTDQYWSVNIKKGLLSLLEINTEWLASHTSSYADRRRISRQHTPSTYTVMEKDTTGECESNYHIDITNSTDPNAMFNAHIIKTRNFNECRSRQIVALGLFAGFTQVSSTVQNMMDRLSTTDYVLMGDRRHVVLQSATLRARYQFPDMDANIGLHATTDIMQKLTLFETSDELNVTSQSDWVVDKLGLMTDHRHGEHEPDPVKDDKAHEKQYRQLVDEKLTTVLHSMHPSISESCTRYILELHNILRYMPHRQLHDVIMSYHVSAPQSNINSLTERKKQLLLNLVSTLPSPDVVYVLSDLIIGGHLNGQQVVSSVGLFSLVVKPVPAVVNRLLKLYSELKQGQDDCSVCQTVLLAVGTVTDRMLVAAHSNRRQNEDMRTAANTILNELEKLLEDANSEDEKIQVLEALSNIGSRSVITVLKSVAEDKTVPSPRRVAAVLAMRRVARQFQLHPLLLSIFLDRQQAPDVRSASLLTIVRSQPSLTTLELLAHSLNTETNQHIRTLVYSNIVNLAKQTSPAIENRQVSSNACIILRLMPPISITLNDSQSLFMSSSPDASGLGWSLKVDLLRSLTSKFPEVFNSLAIFANVFRQPFPVVEVGFGGQQHGGLMESIANSPLGVLFHNILSGQPWSGSQVLESVRNSWNRMGRLFAPENSRKVVNDDDDDGDDDVNMANVFWHLLVMDHKLLSGYADVKQANNRWLQTKISSTLRNMVSELTKGYSINTTYSVALASNSIIVPTSLGLPLTINVSAVASGKIDGKIKSGNISYLLSTQDLSQLKDVQLRAQLRPSVSVLLIGNVGVDCRWLSTGSAFKATLTVDVPFDIQLGFNTPDKAGFSLQYNIPKQDINLLQFSTMPFNFIHYYPSTIDRLPFATRFAPIVDKTSPAKVPLKRQWACDMLGTAVEVTANQKHKVLVTLKSIHQKANPLTLQIHKSAAPDLRNGEKYSRTQSKLPLTTTPNTVQVDEQSVYSSKYQVDIGARSTAVITLQLTSPWNLNGSHFAIQVMNGMDYLILMNGFAQRQTAASQTSTGAPHTTIANLNISWAMADQNRQNVNVQLSKVYDDYATSQVPDRALWLQRIFNPKLSSSTSEFLGDHLYAIDINFSKADEFENQLISDCYDAIKYRWYPYITLSTPETFNCDNQGNNVRLLYKLMPEQNKMNVMIKTSQKTDVFAGIPVDNAILKWLQ